MKFKENDILYYVCPISFIIEKVRVEYAVKEFNQIFYIDLTGAYLHEECLHYKLKDAKGQAIKLLNNYYQLIYAEILQSNPEMCLYNDLMEDEDF